MTVIATTLLHLAIAGTFVLGVYGLAVLARDAVVRWFRRREYDARRQGRRETLRWTERT